MLSLLSSHVPRIDHQKRHKSASDFLHLSLLGCLWTSLIDASGPLIVSLLSSFTFIKKVSDLLFNVKKKKKEVEGEKKNFHGRTVKLAPS